MASDEDDRSDEETEKDKAQKQRDPDADRRDAEEMENPWGAEKEQLGVPGVFGGVTDAVAEPALGTPGSVAAAPAQDPSSRGCSPKLMALAAVVVLAILAGLALLTADDEPTATKTAGAPAQGQAPADPNATVFTGSSGGPVGCIPCDGKARFIPIQSPPGPKSFADPGGLEQAAVDLAPGTYQNLRVEVDRSDRGRWNVVLYPTQLGCAFQPGDRSCEIAGPFVVTETVPGALVVGNDGDPEIYARQEPGGPLVTYGDGTPFIKPDRATDGTFTMTFTFEYVPAVG